MSKIIVGEYGIANQVVRDILHDFYRDQVSYYEYAIGPPCDAVDSAVFSFSGRWKVVGDPDSPEMMVEVIGRWNDTFRKFINWGWAWPFWDVVESKRTEYTESTWISEYDITWHLPGEVNEGDQ
jgi:hypothetical protein